MEIKTIDQYILSMMHDPALLEDEADLLNGCKNTEEYIIKKLLACEDECDRYAEKIADLENNNRGLHNELKNAEQRIKELEDKLRTKAKAKDTTAPVNDSSDLSDPSADMMEKNANLGKDNLHLKRLVDFAEKRIAELEIKLQLKDDIIEQDKQCYTEMSAKIEELKQKNADLTQENMVLQKKCEELHTTVKQCGQEIVKTKKIAGEMKDKLDYCSLIQDKYYAALESALREQRSPCNDEAATEDDDEDDCDYDAYDNYM